jgi:hypothetical protein
MSQGSHATIQFCVNPDRYQTKRDPGQDAVRVQTAGGDITIIENHGVEGPHIGDLARKELARRQLSYLEFNRAVQCDIGYKEDSWQPEQQLKVVDPVTKRCAIVRTRGGSKTFDMCKVLMYYASLGFTAFFWCSKASMMAQPKKYMHQLVTRTYLKYAVSKLLEESITFKNGGSFEILNLTEDTARSKRGDINYYDELSRADEKAFHASEPTLSVSKLAKAIYGGTPEFGSVLHDVVKELQAEGGVVLEKSWKDCSFIDKDFIAREKKNKPAWFFRQEYECSWEAPSGAVFQNVQYGDFSDKLIKQKSNYLRHVIHFGLDWNPIAGHYISGTRWADDYTFICVLYEENLGSDLNTTVTRIIALMEQNPLSSMEVEDGGTNSGYCDALFMELYKRKNPVANRMYRRPWDSAGKNKMNTITNLLPITIYCDEAKTPEVADWFGKAHWDEEASTPTLEKDPDQHALDAFLHSSWIGKYGQQDAMN